MNKRESLDWLKSWYRAHRSELQTQPDMVRAIKADNQVETTIHDLYLALFNQTLGGCGSCLADALIVLFHYPEQKMQKIMECNFKLRAGELLMDSNGVLPHATAANLTDDIAIAYLRDNRARLDMFESVPDNIDEILADTHAGDENDEPDAAEESATDSANAPQIEENDGDEELADKTASTAENNPKRKYTKRAR